MPKKKKLTKPQRREVRLQKARQWVLTYEGKHIVRAYRKRFADGKVSLAYSSFLGYRKGEDGQMEVVPEEAETVRLIYRLFMQGQTPYAIAKYLTDKSIPTPTGKETWRHRTVENILIQRKVQRRRPPAEVLHGGLPFQEAQGERRGGAAVLCGGQP